MSNLAPNQNETIGQVFVIGGILVTLPKATKVLFVGPAGKRPWVEWHPSNRCGIDCHVDQIGQVSLQSVATKP